MAEVTSDQIEALTRALGSLESRLGKGSTTSANGNNGTPDVSNLTNSIKKASTDFAGAMMTGTASLSGMAEAAGEVMSVLPGLGGALSKLTVESVRYLERSQKSFNALAASGGGFAGNLGELNRAAAATRLPLDQFTKLVGANAQNLTALGGGVNEGARRFAELSNAMFETGAIDNFMALGMTLEDSNEFLMDYTAMSRRSARFQQMDADQRARSAAAMAESFDTLAKLTGKQAKDIKNEIMERQNQGATQARLRLLEKQGVAGAVDAYNAAQTGLSGGPQVLQNLMDDLIQTGVPMSEATAAFAATNKEAFALAKQAAEATKAGNVEEAQRLSEQAAAAALEYADSEQGLRLATLSQVSQIAEGQAQALEEVGTTIDALNENAKKMKEATGDLATTSQSYANLLEQMAVETQKQVALQEPGQQALRFVNEAQQGLANASKVARDSMAGMIENNGAFTDALGTAADAIDSTFDPNKLNALSQFMFELNSVATAEQEAQATTGDPNATGSQVAQARRSQQGNIEDDIEPGIIDGITNWFKGVFGMKATGGTISPGHEYIAGEEGPELITQSPGSVMNAAQTANAFSTASQNSTQDMNKLINAMETANDQLSTLIAINTKQTMLSDKQVKAIKGAGNLMKGI